MRHVLADQEDYGMSVDDLIWLTVEYRAELQAIVRGRTKTKWFSPTDPKPTLPGVYEVRFCCDPNRVRFFARWHNGYWTPEQTSTEIETTRYGVQEKYWRGLASDPQKGEP